MTTYTFPVIQGSKTGKKLKELRKKKGYKVASICACMGGISEQAVYKWERGDSLPSIDNLLALSCLYRVPMEELIVYEETEMVSFNLRKNRMSYARTSASTAKIKSPAHACTAA